MTRSESTKIYRYEPRWLVALTIVAVIGLLALLPGRIKLFPAWFPYILGILEIIPIIAVRITKANPRWLRLERWVTLIFVAFMCLER